MEMIEPAIFVKKTFRTSNPELLQEKGVFEKWANT